MRVTVEVDSILVAVARSPLYTILSALTGISVTFAPLFLYWSGQGKFDRYEKFVVPACFAVIYFVGLFYLRLGNILAKELRRRTD